MDEHRKEPHCHLVLRSVIDLESVWEGHCESAPSSWPLLQENALEKTSQFEQFVTWGGGSNITIAVMITRC